MTIDRNVLALSATAAAALALVGCGERLPAASNDDAPAADTATASTEPADDAAGESEVAPAETTAAAPAADGLGPAIGTVAPSATVLDAEGSEIQLASLYESGPVVLVFYRGGWCGYCNQQLADWQSRLPELTAAGGTLVALSPEKPSETANTAQNNDASFLILSDASFQAADAFGLRFSLNDATKERYEGFGIMLQDHNASGTWDLPHPGTFVIDTEGVIRWKQASEQFQSRPDAAEIIAFVETL